MGYKQCSCQEKNVPHIYPKSCKPNAVMCLREGNENVVAADPTALAVDTEVVVIGNGPSGISLSAFLSGLHPRYNRAQAHPDEHIADHFFSKNASLIDQDLSWFQDECAERINPTVGAFPALYDTLARPPIEEVDHPFLDSGEHKSSLKWSHCPWRAVQHIVLGDGDIGGSWNGYDDDMVTVSLAHWMDLPGFSVAQWLGCQSLISRLPAAMIREYFRAYTKQIGIEENFRPFTKVTNAAKFFHAPSGEEFWEVSGIDLRCDRPFLIKCRKIVLACGRSHPKTLKVGGPNESESSVIYDIASMKHFLSVVDEKFGDQKESISSLSAEKQKQVVVVGDGISAADAVLHCLANSIPVLQLIRRNESQLRNVMISRLSAVVYPEYAKVFRLMTKREADPNYRCLTSAQVNSLEDGTAAIETPHGVIKENFLCVVACVGRQSQLEMLEQEFEFLANYQASSDPSLFAIGSLAGDHFVRYLVGGALQVAQTLIKQNDKKIAERLQQKIAKETANCQSKPIPCKAKKPRSEHEQEVFYLLKTMYRHLIRPDAFERVYEEMKNDPEFNH